MYLSSDTLFKNISNISSLLNNTTFFEDFEVHESIETVDVTDETEPEHVNVMKTPGVLETVINHDQQNEKFVVQVIDFRTKTDGSLNLFVSDGKLKTWMVDCDKELVI